MKDDIRYHSATLHEFKSTSSDGPIRAALSSDKPIDVRGGKEVLSHADGAIDWGDSLNSGLPLTIGHSERDPFSQQLPIGRVERMTVDDGVMRGDLVFDAGDDNAQAARGKVERGIARNVSITFRVLDAEQTDESLSTITRWRPMAASLVTLPADASVGVGRSVELANDEGSSMETTAEQGSAQEPTVIDKVQGRANANFQRGQSAARQDAAEIVSRGANLRESRPDLAGEIDELVSATLKDDGATVSRFNELALELITGRAEPVSKPGPAPGEVRSPIMDGRRPVIEMGASDVSKKLRGLEQAILARAVPTAVKQEDLHNNEYRNASLLDASRMHLEFAGVKTFGMTNEQIAKAALRMGRDETGSRYIMGAAQYETSNFPAMTENIGFKAMFDGFSRAPRTWDIFADTGSAPDFKQFSVPRLSHTQQLAVVAENAQYGNLTRSDAKETGTLTKKGGLVSYTWEATINNDINGFTDQLVSSGEAAQATLDTDVWATFTLNKGVGVAGPVMGDTNQLFDNTNHSNYGTSALDLAGIVNARVLMGRQTDDNTNPQAIAPRLSYVAVPLELEDEALNLSTSEFLVDSGGAAQRANTVRNTFEVVATHHLTDVNDWFGLARKGQTVRVFFLNGEQSPQLEQAQSFDYDSVSYKVRFVYIPVWRDWRGAVWMEVA